MLRRVLDCVTKRTNTVIIVGAGKTGREMMEFIEENSDITVKAFFDNNEDLIGNRINNIEIMKPYKEKDEKVLYVVAVVSPKMRDELCAQLEALKIQMDDIVVCYPTRDYAYLSSLDEKYYEEEIQDIYFQTFGKKINWQHPSTYNEIINWERLNVKDERRTRLADKFLVRDWVKEQIGEKYLTKLYGVWDNAEDIDFEALPDAFVLKVNNGSGRNIVVKDKSKIDQGEIRRQLNEWKRINYAYMFLEFQYKDIVPKIICEEYLEGVAENVYDYNIYCFHGEPAYIWCIRESHKPDCKASFYSKDWEMMPFSYGYPKDEIIAPRPEKLEEMLEISRVLSKDFQHVRVDLYNLPDGRVLFGEMTFTTWGGWMHWEPEEYDLIFGKMILGNE